MNETAISWTVPNWITVFLMVLLGSLVMGAAIAAFAKFKSNSDAG